VVQGVWPAEHVVVHVPFEQACPAAHTVPHAPQFCGSVLKFVQKALAPDPQAFGSAAGQPQVPLVQAWPAGQTVPHPPQLFGSFVVVAQ